MDGEPLPGPESRVFTTRSTPEGTVVTFGDGLHGKCPRPGLESSLLVGGTM
jgi:hypothetical protein